MTFNTSKGSQNFYREISMFVDMVKDKYDCYPFYNIGRVEDLLKLFGKHFLHNFNCNRNGVNECFAMVLAIMYHHAALSTGEKDTIGQAVYAMNKHQRYSDNWIDDDTLAVAERLIRSQEYILTGIPKDEYEKYDERYKLMVSIYHDILNSHLVGSYEDLMFNLSNMVEECKARNIRSLDAYCFVLSAMTTLVKRDTLFYSSTYAFLEPITTDNIQKAIAFYNVIVERLQNQEKSV